MEWKKSTYIKDWFLTGSREICSPPVMDTDIDYCIICKSYSDLFYFQVSLDDAGYSVLGRKYPNSSSCVFRKGNEDLILFREEIDFRRWKVATQLAKRFNLVEKEDRVALFSALRDPSFEGNYSRPCVEEWV